MQNAANAIVATSGKYSNLAIVGPEYLASNSPLKRILNEMPYLAYCSDNKTAALVRPKEYALRQPYAQINRKDMCAWLIFDLDHPNCYIYEEQGLPEPNLIVKNKTNGHSQLFYAIEPVCLSEKASLRPIRYMKSIYQAMALELKADMAYTCGPISKTPGHELWHTEEIHNAVYSLGQLADYVELINDPVWVTKADDDDAHLSHSRHCVLFDELRHYAYAIVASEREKGSYERFLARLDNFANSKNNFAQRGFDDNLPDSSLRATIKSVGQWTWDRYRGRYWKIARGVMGLSEQELSLKEKQRLSAARSAELKIQKTKEALLFALKKAKTQGYQLSDISNKLLSEFTGLSRQTISKYLPEILKGATGLFEDFKETLKKSLKAIKARKKFVNFGVYQVTGVFVLYPEVMRNHLSVDNITDDFYWWRKFVLFPFIGYD